MADRCVGSDDLEMQDTRVKFFPQISLITFVPYGLHRQNSICTPVLLLCGPPPQEGAALCVALCLSVCPSVRPVIVAIGNVFSSTGCTAPLASLRATQRITMTQMYFSARTEGRISYGHLGRTNSCFCCADLSRIRTLCVSRIVTYKILWPFNKHTGCDWLRIF